MTDFSPDLDNSDNLDGSAPSYHMSPDEFRRHGHALVEWLAHYMETVDERQVMPDVEPGDIAASIPATAPEKPERFEDLVALVALYRPIAEFLEYIGQRLKLLRAGLRGLFHRPQTHARRPLG